MDGIYHYSTDNQCDAVSVKATEAVAKHCYPYCWGSTKQKKFQICWRVAIYLEKNIYS